MFLALIIAFVINNHNEIGNLLEFFDCFFNINENLLGENMIKINISNRIY